MTTTNAELAGMVQRVRNAAANVGLDSAGWTLHGGNATHHIQYKLTTGKSVIGLGFSKDSAWFVLAALETAWLMVEDNRKAE
jgi:hypothetical protein